MLFFIKTFILFDALKNYILLESNQKDKLGHRDIDVSRTGILALIPS